MWAPGRGGVGSIPAWAGETAGSSHQPTSRPVDPRVGGGDTSTKSGGRSNSGRSPRGRGRPTGRGSSSALVRSIPAWAGETLPLPVPWGAGRVDPRVGGGDYASLQTSWWCGGRSPRGRGRLNEAFSANLTNRSIPAWAGETRQAHPGPRGAQVDPRVGGGDRAVSTPSPRVSGRSPRGRGRHRRPDARHLGMGSIPAWAGETGHRHEGETRDQVDPRVGGGDGNREAAVTVLGGRSPRGRGRLRS